jgi:hypothetical protein
LRFLANISITVCFYVFDQDKTGFFSVDDMNNLVNAVHNVRGGETIRGTVKLSWMKLTFAGNEFEFEEFKRIHNAFPRLFEPAFRLQQSMMRGFMGENWWGWKKDYVIQQKELADEKIKAIERKKQKKKERKKNRKTQRAMGSLRYYLCPCMRKYYDPSLSAYDRMTDEEKAIRDEEIAFARRQAELRVKNPETAVWLKYQNKVAKENQVYSLEVVEEEEMDAGVKAITNAASAATAAITAEVTSAKPGGLKSPRQDYIVPSLAASKVAVVNTYIDKKLVHTEENRHIRAESRAQRKAARDRDPDLKQKIRTTVSGAEI